MEERRKLCRPIRSSPHPPCERNRLFRCGHPIEASHATGHVVGHVAMVEPFAGSVFDPLKRARHAGAQHNVVCDCAIRAEPTVPVHVKGMKFAPDAHDAPAHAVTNLGGEVWRPARVGAPVDDVQKGVPQRWSSDESGRLKVGQHYDILMLGSLRSGVVHHHRADEPRGDA